MPRTKRELLAALRVDHRATEGDPQARDTVELVIMDRLEAAGHGREEYSVATGKTVWFAGEVDGYVDQKRREGRSAKYVDELHRLLSRFASAFPSETTVTTPALRDYVAALPGRNGQAALAQMTKTVSRVRAFLEYCGAEQALKAARPVRFAKDRRTKDAAKWRSYTDSHVAALLDAAESYGRHGPALKDLITLAMYTGGRIEELCRITAEQDGVALHIPGTKTSAAARTI
ncbi:MAG: hypothetical protein AAGG11_02575, partial [Pseudomonadota bacterium]